MVRKALILLFIKSFFLCSVAQSAPSNFTYQGQIIKPSGHPLEAASVTFTVEVLSPGAEECLLFQESHTLNMSGSNGIFSLQVGSGTQSGADYEDITSLTTALNNSTGLVTPTTCAAVGTYTPVSTDGRKLRITFDDGSGPVTVSQDHNVVSVPYADSASSIDGLTSAQLLRTNTGGSFVLNQANIESVFTSTNYPELMALLGGTSTQYLSSSPAGNIDANANKIINLDPPTAGTDAANKNYVDGNVGGAAADSATISSLGAGNSGEVLTWNGTQWTSTAPSGDSTKLPLAGGTMTGAINMGNQNITNANDIAAGNDVSVGNNLTVTNNVTITGGIGVGTGVNSAGTITLNTQNVLRFGDSDDSNFVGFAAPGVVGSDIIWTLPNTDGGAGQILSTDGAGNLSWVNDSAPVTSVHGRSGVVVAAASDYDANQIDNTAAGNIAATDVQAAINELDAEKVAKAGDTMTGALQMGSTNELRFGDADDSNYIGFVSPGIVASNQIWVLPNADGANGEILQTDGSGNLSFVAIPSAPVTSIHGRTGVVVAAASDYDANQIDNTAAGTIAATDVQGAINELDTEKVATTRNVSTAADSGLTGGGDLSADRSLSLDIPGTTDLGAPAVGADSLLIYDASGTAIREVTRTQLVLSEAEVDAFVSNNGYLTSAVASASNQGTAGVGLYDNLNGSDLELRNINTASSKVTIALDAGNKEVDIDVSEANFDQTAIPNTPAGNIAAANIQAAINELDAEKVAKAGDIMTGDLNLDNEQELRLSEADGNGANYVGFKAAATLAGDQIWTLPAADGANGEVLQTDGSGALSWVAIASAPVTSIHGRTGVVVAAASDYDANQIDNTAAGTIAATDVQGAINELDTEKVATTRNVNTAADSGLTGGGDLSADRSLSLDFTGTTDLGAPAVGADSLLIYDASGTAIREVTRTQLVLSEAEVDAFVGNNGYVANSRNINTAADSGLSGGGDLSADRSLSLDIPGTTDLGASADNADSLIVYDASGTANREVTRAQLVLSEAEVDAYANNNGYAADADKVDRAGDTMTGDLNLDNEQELRLSEADGNGANYVGFKAAATLAGDQIWTLPAADGANGEVLQTDGSGALSWVAIASAPVTSVHGRTGVVVAAASDYDANQIDNTAAGTIAATDVQGAINELDTEKVATTRNVSTAADSGLTGGGDLSADRSLSLDIPGTTDLGAAADNADSLIVYDASGTANREVTRAQLVLSEAEVDAYANNNGYAADADKVDRAGDTMTGALQMGSTNELRFGDADNSNYVGFVSPGIVASDQIWVLPNTDGANNEVLATDGSGNLSFIAIPSAPVTSVHGRTGVVVAAASDYDANQIDNTAAGTIAATDVQGAINELDTEKVATTRNVNTAADSGLTGGGDLSADRSLSLDIPGTTDLGASADNADSLIVYDASGTANREVTRAQLVLSEAEVDAYANNNGYAADADKVDRAGDTMTGDLNLDNEQELRLSEADGNGANYVGFKAAATLAGDQVWTLPAADGANGEVLQTDGSGALSWVAIASAPVTSIHGRTGVVVAAASDYDANQIDNTAAGTIAATDVQGAINELDTEKVATTRNVNTAADSGLTGGGDLSADRSLSLDFTGTTDLGAPAVGADSLLIYDASGTAIREVTRTQLVLSEAEVDAFVGNNGYVANSRNINTAADSGLSGGGDLSADRSLSLDIPGTTDLGASADNADSLIVYDASGTANREVTRAQLVLSEAEVDAYANNNGYAADADKVDRAGDTMTGDLNLDNEQELRLSEADGNGANYVGFKAAATLAGDQVWTLPAADGANGEVLQTDGSGALSWVAIASAPVTSVHGRTGVVVAAASDYDANQIDNTAAGTIAATDVQGAINELDTEKVATTRNVSTAADSGLTGGGDLSADRSLSLDIPGTTDLGAPAVGADSLLIYDASGTAIREVTRTQLVLSEAEVDAFVGNNGYLTSAVASASNQGTAGIGIYDNLNGSDLELRNINAASSKVTVALDAGNKEVDIDVSEANFDQTAIPNTPAGNIAAANIQAAINELDTEKVAKAGDTMTGALQMGSTNELRFGDADDSNYVGFVSPGIVASDQIWVLPNTDGANNEVLATDGSGNLSFIAIPSAPVTSVHGRTGVVVAAASDYDANQIDNTAAGTIAATDVQGAINELDTEKVATTRNVSTAADSGLTGGGDLSADRSLSLDIPGTTDLGAAADNADSLIVYDASGTANREVTRAQLVLSEAEVDAYANNNGYAADADKVDRSGDTMTGDLNLDNEQELRLSEADGNGANYVGFKAAATLAGDQVWTLPAADGTSGQVLQTDGSGVLSWVAQTSGADHLGNHTATTNLDLANNNIVNLAAGSAGSPSLSFQADSNTGIYSSSADIISLATSGHKSLDVGNSTFNYFSANGVSADPIFSGYGAPSTSSVDLTIRRSDGGGNGSEVLLPQNHRVASLIGQAWDGTSYLDTAHIQFWTDAATGAGDMPGRITFSTTSNGASSATERMRLNSVGDLGIGTNDPNEKLDVEGSILSGPKGTSAGDSGAIKFEELATNGTNSVGFRAPDSIAANVLWQLPATDGTSGQVLQTNGSGILSWASAGGSGDFMKDGSVAMTGQFEADAGSAAAPGITFDGNENTGIFWNGFNQIKFSTAGTEAASISSNGLSLNGTDSIFLRNSNHLETTPPYTFNSDTDTGMFRPAADTLAYSTGGSERMRIASNGRVGIGSDTPNSALDVVGDITISGDYNLPNTGGHLRSGGARIFLDSTNDLVSFYTNGSERMRLSSDRFGIGTTTPGNPIHVYKATGDLTGEIETGGATDNATMTYKNGTDEWSAGLVEHEISTGVNTLGYMIIDGTTPRFTIDNAGKVGLNYSKPRANLQMGTTARTAGDTLDSLDEYMINLSCSHQQDQCKTINYAAGFSSRLPTTGGSNGRNLTYHANAHEFFAAPNAATPTMIIDQSGYAETTDAAVQIVGHNTSSGEHSLKVKNSSTTTFVIENTGDVGIGSTSPRATLDVNGAIAAAPAVVDSGGTLDFAGSNFGYTASSCGTFNLHNMKDGATYTMAIQGTTAATCTFNAYSDAGTTALTVKLPPGHGATTAAKETLYSFVVIGTKVYVSWVPGY